MIFVIIILAATLLGALFFARKDKQILEQYETIEIDENILAEEVKFFADLPVEKKKMFVVDMKDFLSRVKITGVDTTVETLDIYLIAAGAVIPVFNFPKWKYYNLKEVLIYSDAINTEFESKEATERNILGMVGTGYMNGKMLISKPALRHSFSNKTDKHNTVIHEFIHLIDKADGDADGLPETVLNHQYILPWTDLIQKEMKNIYNQKSDIDSYALVNQAEFFAVVGAYFFERPDLLEEKHPQIYKMMERIFNHPI